MPSGARISTCSSRSRAATAVAVSGQQRIASAVSRYGGSPLRTCMCLIVHGPGDLRCNRAKLLPDQQVPGTAGIERIAIDHVNIAAGSRSGGSPVQMIPLRISLAPIQQSSMPRTSTAASALRTWGCWLRNTARSRALCIRCNLISVRRPAASEQCFPRTVSGPKAAIHEADGTIPCATLFRQVPAAPEGATGST